MDASELGLLAAGVFFLSCLVTGVWKYASMMRTTEAQAPVYVDVAHRASLMYAFASILMREFVPYSPVNPTLTLWAMGVPLLFFGAAIVTYLVHGVLNDTDNQLRRPHVLGGGHLSPWVIRGFMGALIVGEIGGFVVLFAGFLRALA